MLRDALLKVYYDYARGRTTDFIVGVTFSEFVLLCNSLNLDYEQCSAKYKETLNKLSNQGLGSADLPITYVDNNGTGINFKLHLVFVSDPHSFFIAPMFPIALAQ